MTAANMPQETEENALDRFALEARHFCAWARGDDGATLDARSALVRIVSLYQAALFLPHPWTDDLEPETADVKIPETERERVRRRASELPCKLYSEIFNPFEASAEPVTGHLADDIGDIYNDVARGLALFDRGQRDEASWEWGFNLQIHWGEHATSAIRALHSYLAQENPEDLGSNT